MYTKEFLSSTGYFVENEWYEKYVSLINNCSLSAPVPFQTQKHHILPRHYFKQKGLQIDNSKENVVNLLFKDHMLAHLYLSGCTIGKNRYWNLYSIFMMTGRKIYDVDSILADITSLDFYTKLYTEAISAAPNHRKGTHVTEETRKKMSESKSGKTAHNKKTVWVNDGERDYMIKENNLDEYLNNGYTKGRLYKHSQKTKDKIAIASHNKIITDEFRLKMSNIASKQTHTIEQNLENSRRLKEYYKTHPNPFLGKKHTEESKQKNRESHIGRVWINNGNICKVVNNKEVEKYLANGFVLGRIKK